VSRRGLILVSVVVALAVVAGIVGVVRTEPNWYVRLRYPLHYQSLITGYGRVYHIDPALLGATIYEESRFNATTRSPAGAIGLMQLLPSTARGIAIRTGGHHFRVPQDLLNPDLNVRYGSWYLSHLLQTYHGNTRLALAAYNAGEANVNRWIAQKQNPLIQYASTRSYVSDILHLQKLYRRAYAKDLGYSS
jgi:soluble lytic murein transglycosylase